MTDRPLYRYAASFVRTIDGDTVVLDLSLGFDIYLKVQRIRLFGIDAPEMHGPEAARAREAKAFTEGFLVGAAGLYIESNRYSAHDSFGRILATIFRADDPVSLNDALLSAGLATPMQG